MKTENVAMELMTCVGDARVYSYEALKCANEGKYKKAEELFKMAEKEIEKAYDVQNKTFKMQIDSEEFLVSAENHLKTVISENNIIGEMIKLKKIVNEIENIL